MSDFDLIVIGAGPGGYAAALRGAQAGMRVACIDERTTAGGTCLNVGCIPSKALLSSTEHWAEFTSQAEYGIESDNARFDVAKIMIRKDRVVSDLAKGIAFLFKKAGVEFVNGRAAIAAPGRVSVGDREITATKILIATGSTPTTLPGVAFDETRILSSTGALALAEVPQRLAVVGAGVIGLEIGQIWSRLGAKVTIIEYLDRILPGLDSEIAKSAQRLLAKQGISFTLNAAVRSVAAGDLVTIEIENRSSAAVETLEADAVLVAIGRRPHTAGLGLEALGVKTDARGFIEVDAQFRTNIPGILAIGDTVPGPMLAHKAEEDAAACIDALAGKPHPAPDYGLVPGVVYTSPEIAGVGLTEDGAHSPGRNIVVGKSSFIANGRARAIGATDGFVKVIACPETGKLLGGHILGHGAGELLQELVLGLRLGATVGDIVHTSHAHPGMGEAVKEACQAALNAPATRVRHSPA
ncbi:MAG TPA: dihydrolipoyl dehydrogenase [Mesorhizobium sp.]|jgi:dihydrolipoamide dehydrogenase|uniref:dihydrolipoyl dehydrogenase n=1 Tax=Mesorhizobium sp. TaxID=1871066 RepID=UPI002DDCA30B|nr:dihydrolipoyl dehydrogenase [Mesorhizobium sp.]HEV2501800.1 dihydrolipoyl dehydrogenase [Mesorhizobium sp.]